MIDNSRDKIEDIKRRLYDIKNKNVNRHLEGVLHQVPHKINEEWQDEELEKQLEDMKNRKPKMSIFKKIFIGSFLFFIIAVSYALYMFYNGDVSVTSEKIDISVLGNAFTKGGVELPVLIEITNRNNVDLELVNMIVEYPSGANDDPTSITRLPKEAIGIIKSGESITKNVKVKLYGEEKSTRNIVINLEYQSEGSNAIFTKQAVYPVTISSAPLSLGIEAPTSAVSDQEYSFNVKALLNSSVPNSNTILQISYPDNFIFEDATPKPDFYGNNSWDLSKIETSTPFDVTVKGKIVGDNGEEKVFHVYAGIANSLDKSKVSVVYNSLLHKVEIKEPFLEAKIISPDSISGGDTVNVEISWANNLPTEITDASIVAVLSGNALVDKSIMTPQGFYDSLNNKITWDRNTSSLMSQIEPGEKGKFSFSFKSKSFVGLNSVKDPNVSINVSIKGRQSTGSIFENVDNFSNKVIKVLSDFQIAVGAKYLSGSLPPKAETETKYVITWSLSNNVNNISGAKATASLPVYVDWVGTKDNGGSVTYNEFTREVVWNIGQVSRDTGISSNREASFIVSLKPSVSQLGSVPVLLKETKLQGQDNFANSLISKVRNSITTNLPNDPSSNIGGGRVVQ